MLRLSPNDADTHFNRGFILEQAGRSREAVAAFAEAVRLRDVLDRAWYGMGLAHARLGEHAEAARCLARCAELQPMNGEGFYQWGMACHHANQPDEVKKIVRKLADFDPKRAIRLIKDAERADLKHLISEEVQRFFEGSR